MELIDKNALVEYLERMGNEIYAGNDEYFIGQKAGLMKVVGVIMTFPTVEERKHGRWEGGGAYYCSNCNSYAATDVFGGGLDITEQHYSNGECTYKDSYGCNCCRFVLMNGQTYCQGYERDEDHDSN